MPAYATFTDDVHYHLLAGAARLRTLCELSTKGAKRGVRERRPPAVVAFTAPKPIYSPCARCVQQAVRRRGIVRSEPAMQTT